MFTPGTIYIPTGENVPLILEAARSQGNTHTSNSVKLFSTDCETKQTVPVKKGNIIEE